MTEYLVKTEVIEVDSLWCQLGFYSAKIYGYIYIVRRKFLWWNLKPFLEVRIYTPYLEKPYFDGERATNRLLSSKEIELRGKLEIAKDRIQRRLDRLLR